MSVMVDVFIVRGVMCVCFFIFRIHGLKHLRSVRFCVFVYVQFLCLLQRFSCSFFRLFVCLFVASKISSCFVCGVYFVGGFDGAVLYKCSFVCVSVCVILSMCVCVCVVWGCMCVNMNERERERFMIGF